MGRNRVPEARSGHGATAQDICERSRTRRQPRALLGISRLPPTTLTNGTWLRPPGWSIASAPSSVRPAQASSLAPELVQPCFHYLLWKALPSAPSSGPASPSSGRGATGSKHAVPGDGYRWFSESTAPRTQRRGESRRDERTTGIEPPLAAEPENPGCDRSGLGRIEGPVSSVNLIQYR